ncbi:uncharacterized protein [Spinacia oleracea]|uniref:Uncharacterized protein isoform X2 n=1 Tax=Spinacia oleracea TaxID=3562 RepID=A0ABM3QMP9_SPIOL|nr:uncharacterized protein LOC110788437 isoform X2 [Spinacia oleracea]
MDESWRKSMAITGMGGTGTALEPEDFNDVFGGPPRSVLARKMSADFSSNDLFYNEIFRPCSEMESPGIISGRRLPEFVIPENIQSKRKQMMKSMCRSKSTSSSVMSFDELNQLNNFRNAAVIVEEDVALASYTSNLRPLNMPSRCTASTLSMPKNNEMKQDLPGFAWSNVVPYFGNDKFNADDMIQNLGYSRTGTPQTTNLENIGIECIGEYDVQLLSNSPIVNYVGNQVNYEIGETNNSEASDIVEAIAWAKEKFQGGEFFVGDF